MMALEWIIAFIVLSYIFVKLFIFWIKTIVKKCIKEEEKRKKRFTIDDIT